MFSPILVFCAFSFFESGALIGDVGLQTDGRTDGRTSRTRIAAYWTASLVQWAPGRGMPSPGTPKYGSRVQGRPSHSAPGGNLPHVAPTSPLPLSSLPLPFLSLPFLHSFSIPHQNQARGLGSALSGRKRIFYAFWALKMDRHLADRH